MWVSCSGSQVHVNRGRNHVRGAVSAVEKLTSTWACEGPKSMVVRVNLEGPNCVLTEFSALLGLCMLMEVRDK